MKTKIITRTIFCTQSERMGEQEKQKVRDGGRMKKRDGNVKREFYFKMWKKNI